MIVKVSVHAGRTFNDPYEQYANLRPSLSLEAEIEQGEDAMKVLKDLQRTAETCIEEHKAALLNGLHKAALLNGLEKMNRLRTVRDRISALRHSLRVQQDELADAEKENEVLTRGELPCANVGNAP